jgi:hypothetical protein
MRLCSRSWRPPQSFCAAASCRRWWIDRQLGSDHVPILAALAWRDGDAELDRSAPPAYTLPTP